MTRQVSGGDSGRADLETPNCRLRIHETEVPDAEQNEITSRAQCRWQQCSFSLGVCLAATVQGRHHPHHPVDSMTRPQSSNQRSVVGRTRTEAGAFYVALVPLPRSSL